MTSPPSPSSPGPLASDLLTVDQAAELLHLSPSSIRSYIREGKLKAFRIAGLRKALIPREAVMGLPEAM